MSTACVIRNLVGLVRTCPDDTPPLNEMFHRITRKSGYR